MKVSKSLIFFDVDTVSFNLADLNQLHILSSEESLWRWLALEEGLMMARDSILGLSPNPNSFFTPFPRQYWYFQPKARIKKNCENYHHKDREWFWKSKRKTTILLIFTHFLYTGVIHPSWSSKRSSRDHQPQTKTKVNRWTHYPNICFHGERKTHWVNVWLSGVQMLA